MGQCRGPLSMVEREEICRGLALVHSVRATDRGLGRSASSISRDVGRNARHRACRQATSVQRSAHGGARRALPPPSLAMTS